MRWHKLSEVEVEYISYISIVVAICVPKIIEFGGDLTKFRQKKLEIFLARPVEMQ